MSEEPEEKPKKRRRIAWLGWVLWITTVGGLYFIRDEGQKRDAQIKEDLRSLTAWMESADRNLESINSDKVVAALVRQEENLRSLQDRSEANASGFSKALKQQENLTERLLVTLPSGTSNTGQALELAQEAKDQGDLDLALVYVANAISDQPGDLDLLRKYTDWSLESGNVQILQGTLSLLQDALYGVSPKDVPDVRKLLETVAAFELEDATPKIKVPTPADTYEKLSKVPLESIASDLGKLQSRIEELTSILEEIDGGREGSPEVAKRVNRSLEEAQSCVMAHQVLHLAELRFANLETAAKLVATAPSPVNRTAALSALQGTEAAVNQVWSVSVGIVTPKLRDQLMALPEKLRKEAEMVQDSVEAKDLEIAQAVWDKRPYQHDKLIQNRIIGCQAASQKCAEFLSKLQGPNSRTESAKLNEKMYREMSELKSKQFASYQKWATEVIEETRKKYDGKRIRTNKDAKDAFYKNGIRKIDQSILSPEVAQFFQAVFSGLLSELGGEEQAEIQKSLSFSETKKKLEEF